jgi:hypothetical protein
VEVGHSDTCRKDGIIRMGNGHISCGLSRLFVEVLVTDSNHGGFFPYQVVQLNCCHALIYARDDLLRDGSRIDVFRIKAIAKSGYTGSDLVELYAFLTSICSTVSPLALVRNSVSSGLQCGEGQVTPCMDSQVDSAKDESETSKGRIELTSLEDEHLV